MSCSPSLSSSLPVAGLRTRTHIAARVHLSLKLETINYHLMKSYHLEGWRSPLSSPQTFHLQFTTFPLFWFWWVWKFENFRMFHKMCETSGKISFRGFFLYWTKMRMRVCLRGVHIRRQWEVCNSLFCHQVSLWCHCPQSVIAQQVATMVTDAATWCCCFVHSIVPAATTDKSKLKVRTRKEDEWRRGEGPVWASPQQAAGGETLSYSSY